MLSGFELYPRWVPLPYQRGGTTTLNPLGNVERHITYCDNEERIPVK